MTAVEQTLDPAAQIGSLLILAILGAITAFLSRRAAKGTKQTQDRFSVPDNTGLERDPGPVLAKMELALDDLKEGQKEAAVRQRDVSAKVELMSLQFAKHEGEHAGFSREMERLMQKVFNGERRGEKR